MSPVGRAGPGSWPTASTRLLGVIGDPVRHSLSPVLHNAAFAALGLDWAYAAFSVASGTVADALLGARALGFVGLSVTMPHKEAVADAVDQRSRTVELLGAANTVVFEGGVARGESTDGEGFLADLRSAGFDPSGKNVVVLGAGGAARSTVLSLASGGASSIVVVNRSSKRAARAVALAGAIGRIGSVADLGDADLVVKATPVGMASVAGDETAPGEDGAALARRCSAGQLVVDLVYHPPVTEFLDAAGAAGATTRNGLGMLVHQAAAQVALWTHEAPPLEAMWRAVDENTHGSAR